MTTTLVYHSERCPANAELQAAISWWQVSGPFPIVLTSGVRTDDEPNGGQKALYAQGRTTPGKIVTHAPTAALSAHGHNGAFDASPVREVYPPEQGGRVKVVYTGDEVDAFVRAQAAARFDEMIRNFKQHGLQSGQDFPGLHDLPHFQTANWRDLPLAVWPT